MNLVQEYFVLVNEVVSYRETVYDGATAEVHNRKVKRMGAIATEIEQNFPELKNDFFELLSIENKEIRLWVAHHILEVMTYDDETRAMALKEIFLARRNSEPSYALSNKIWLEKWLMKHPDDALLLA
jgi:hypothetical protein